MLIKRLAASYIKILRNTMDETHHIENNSARGRPKSLKNPVGRYFPLLRLTRATWNSSCMVFLKIRPSWCHV